MNTIYLQIDNKGITVLLPTTTLFLVQEIDIFNEMRIR